MGSTAQFNTGLPPIQTTEEVPRWLAVLGLTAAMTLLVALLRFAIDLLGVVFLIIFVGFSIRTITDWLTEGESVSAWALGAVMSGLAGTAFVVMWLFGSNPALEQIESRLPGPVVGSVTWLESHGWGQRVLLTDRPGALKPGPRLARGGSAGFGGGAPSASPSGPAVGLPSLGTGKRAKRAGTQDDIGVAEASEVEGRSSSRGVERSRTRGLAAQSGAEDDAQPAGNVQTFTTVITSRSSTTVGTAIRSDRLRDDRDRQRRTVGRGRVPTRWRRARHFAAAQRTRRQHRVADDRKPADWRARHHRPLSRRPRFLVQPVGSRPPARRGTITGLIPQRRATARPASPA